MSKRMAILLAAVVALSPSAGLSAAAPRGTPAEAKAMLQKAVGHFKSAGRQQALADFTAGKPPFRDRELYVLCVDSKHVIAANGGFPSFVGTSADALKDTNGNPLGKALWDAASKQAEGSIQYQMLSPVNYKPERQDHLLSEGRRRSPVRRWGVWRGVGPRRDPDPRDRSWLHESFQGDSPCSGSDQLLLYTQGPGRTNGERKAGESHPLPAHARSCRLQSQAGRGDGFPVPWIREFHALRSGGLLIAARCLDRKSVV